MSDSALKTAPPESGPFMGVDSLLKPGSTILYETLFNLRHAGRVVDLIMFESQKFLERTDARENIEARVRHCLELATVALWMHYRSGESSRCLEIEVGWDDAQLVISLAGFVADGVGNVLESQGAVEGDSSRRLARFMTSLEENSTGLMVRHQVATGYFQVIAVFAASSSTPQQPSRYEETPAVLPSEDMASSSGGQVILHPKHPLSQANLEGFHADEEKSKEARHEANAQKLKGADGPVVTEAKRKLKGEGSVGGSVGGDDETVVSGDASAAGDEVIEVSGGPEGISDEAVTVGDEGLDMLSESLTLSGGAGEDDTETLVKGSGPEEMSSTKVTGQFDVADNSKNVVKGGKAVGQDKTKTVVKGGKVQAEDKTKTVVKGGKAPAQDKTKTVLQGQVQEEDDTVTVIGGQKQDYSPDRTAVNVGGDPIKETDENITVIKSVGATAEQKRTIQKIKEKNPNISSTDQVLLKAMEDSGEVTPEIEELISADKEEASEEYISDLIKKLEGDSLTAAPAATELEMFFNESDKEFDTQLKQYETMGKDNSLPQHMKDWLSKTMGELAKNRAELNERMKDINGKWKKADHEFKSQQKMLHLELEKLGGVIRQKNMAIERSKQMLVQSMHTIEKLKTVQNAGNDAESAHKIAQANVLVAKAKEQTEKIQVRLDETQKKFSAEMSVKMALQTENARLLKQAEDYKRKYEEAEKVKSATQADAALKPELDRATRQVEELKKQNKQLQDKLTQTVATKQNSSGGKNSAGSKEPPMNDSEFKHKLEQAAKLQKNLKDELDKTNKRFEESKQAETKLRVEVAKLQAELKAAGRGQKK